MIGSTVSHYRIVEKLGQGGMGIVYKAEDTSLDRFVALKFLPPHLAASEQDKIRFKQEAKAAAALNHPNVCSIIEIAEHETPGEGKQTFLVMELIDGRTIRELKDSISFKQAIDYGIQIAEGLAAAHEKGIVHRDVKPENIMVRKDGIVQIMDFGLAKLRAGDSKISRLTKEGSTVGTAGYMSPEQVQGQDADHRSDIFSYGVLMYELLTGQLPFKGAHEMALAYEIVNVDPVPMSAVIPDLDPALDAIVLECLEKDVNERAQAMKQIAVDLKRYRRESSRQRMSRVTAARPAQTATRIQSMNAVPETVPAQSRGWMRLLPWGIAAMWFAATVLFAFLYFRTPQLEMQSLTASIIPPPGTGFNNSIGGHIALSPDGTMLAFVAADTAGNTSLWVRPLESEQARQIAETNGGQFPFWSPDNRSIGFFADGKLKKILASGSPAIVLCDAPNGRGGTWNAKGDILFAPNYDRSAIMRVSSSGGTPVPATKLDTTRNETNHRWPLFLPDGKHFIFTAQALKRTADFFGAIYVSSIDGSVEKQLLKLPSNTAYYDGHLVYIRNSSLVAQRFDLSKLELSGEGTPIVPKVEFSGDKSRGVFSISATGLLVYQAPGKNTGQIALCDRAGKTIDGMGGRAISAAARFSPDGSMVAFDSPDTETGYADIWLYSITRKIATRFTFSISTEWSPIWSPDGKQIVFSSDGSGSGDLYIKNADGSEAEHLLEKTSSAVSPLDWSSSGKTILMSTLDERTGMDISTIEMDGSKIAESPFLNGQYGENGARFSPNGKWVAYESDESGKLEVYVRPYPAGSGKWQISSNGGFTAMWGGDGRSLYFNKVGGQLFRVDVSTEGSAFSYGNPSLLFEHPRTAVADVSKNGEMFILVTIAGTENFQPITLVTNWDRPLRKP